MRRLNVPRFFSFHIFDSSSPTDSLLSPSRFLFLFSLFLNPLPLPHFAKDRHFIFFTSLYSSPNSPPSRSFILFLDFIPLSRSSRFLSIPVPSTPGPSTLVIFIPTLFHYLFAPSVHIPILLSLSSSLFHFSTFITLHPIVPLSFHRPRASSHYRAFSCSLRQLITIFRTVRYACRCSSDR